MRKLHELTWMLAATLVFSGATAAQAQALKAADLEKYAKEKYGDKWIDAAKIIAEGLTLDKTNVSLYDEQWEIARHYPFVEKDAQKRTCAKALVMTHAYSNAIIDKVEEALKNGIVGNEDDDW